MIVYVLFVHKKSVSKRKVCIIFIKNKKNYKKPKKKHFSGFFKVDFLGFLGGFFIANPGYRRTRSYCPPAPPSSGACSSRTPTSTPCSIWRTSATRIWNLCWVLCITVRWTWRRISWTVFCWWRRSSRWRDSRRAVTAAVGAAVSSNSRRRKSSSFQRQSLL